MTENPYPGPMTDDQNPHPDPETTAENHIPSRILSDILSRILVKLANLDQNERVIAAELGLFLVGVICYVLWSHLESRAAFAIMTLVSIPVAAAYSVYAIVKWNIELWYLFDARFLPIRLDKTRRHEKRTAARERFQNFVLSSEHPVWTFAACLFCMNVLTRSMARGEIVDLPFSETVELIMVIIAVVPFTSLSLDLSRATDRFAKKFHANLRA